MKFWSQTAAILMKDLLIEYRTKDVLTSMLLFGLLVILMFHFAFEPDSEEIRKFGPGLLWMTFIFAGLLGMNRSFAGEKENDALEGLMLSPVNWSSIYLGKMLANLLFLLLAQAIILCLFSLLFNYDIWPRIGWMAAITFLGTLGFSSVGTLLAAVSMNTRMSEVMLPVLLVPLGPACGPQRCPGNGCQLRTPPGGAGDVFLDASAGSLRHHLRDSPPDDLRLRPGEMRSLVLGSIFG